MLKNSFVLICAVAFCSAKEVTFKDVTVRGFSLFVEKFKINIASSKSLNGNLPNIVHDAISIENQNIPVLYKDSLANLNELDELVIEFCNVAEIQPGALKNVPLLRRFSLKGNIVEHIRAGVFNNLAIAVLDLSKNAIETIDSEAFDKMPNLLNIHLSDNRISKWNSDWFKDTPMLTRVSLQNNSLQELPINAFKNLVGEKKYGKFDLTINLVFSHNKIEKIHPKTFTGLKRINNLWLDHNQLTSFKDEFLENIEVDDLRFDHNNIECLEGDLAKILKANSSYIDSNPFKCECLQKMKDWVDANNKTVYMSYSEMECSVQRIRNKMMALERRLKQIKDQ